MSRERDQLFLSSIVQNIPTMIFVKEAGSLRFELFNAAGEQLLGCKQADLLGKNDHDLFPRDQADFFTATDRRVLAGKVVVDVAEEPIDTPHGKRWLHTRKVPVLGDDGEPRYLLGISLDITDRKLAQDALAERNAQLEEIERELKRSLGQLLELERLAVASAGAAELGKRIVAALDANDSGEARSLASELVSLLEVARGAEAR